MKFKGLEIERALVIYAHPDDADFGCSGTVAAWARQGVEVTYCMVTNGASGSQDPKMTRRKLRDIRLREQRAAAKILGVKRVVPLDYEDGYLYPTLEVRLDVARVVRQTKPDLIIAMDPTSRYAGSYVNHPDHIAAAEVALRTINPDASTRQMFPELWVKERLEPHKPKALLLMTFFDGDTYVDVSKTFELKIRALKAHASQVDVDEIDGWVRGWSREVGRKAKVRYAEAFKLIRFDEPPGARARRRRAPTSRPRRAARPRRARGSARRSSTPRAPRARPPRRRRARARRG